MSTCAGDRGAARELRVAVHAAHRVGHSVARGARGHVVGVQRAARAAARGDGEVFLAVLVGPFLVGARDGGAGSASGSSSFR